MRLYLQGGAKKGGHADPRRGPALKTLSPLALPLPGCPALWLALSVVPSPESIAQASVRAQCLCKAEVEEAFLGHHISQELHSRPGQVALMEEVFLRSGQGH